MNAHVIVAVVVAIHEMLKALGPETDKRAQLSDAEVLTVAVVAALYFGNRQERSLCVLKQTGYLRWPEYIALQRAVAPTAGETGRCAVGVD